ncbi:DeoR family transcriptional regulator [Planotetraspora silvatica]|uniref:DeoR family transcriptional regulator n=1 Tax=Planotetraspora silvatica TaxID=234614 RepID=A0A8J3UPN4_9ACTN|nr:DeoR/GlpR family DNA-binding transcription regulator [Planotetraspora silvatica]GII47577.1 DeoR family transcriptional regulator [Planotetraspora silvatica]
MVAPGNEGASGGGEAAKLLSPDRRSQMLALITREGSVQVDELSEIFGVSKVTVRGDLDWLASRQLVTRARGGAVAMNAHALATGFSERAALNSDEKRRIARAAYETLGSNETIILDAGTTVFELSRILGQSSGLTVVTPALNVAAQVTNYADIELMVVGGRFDSQTMGSIGSIAERDVAELPAHRAFVGAHAIDSDFDVVDVSVEVARLKRAIASSAREVVLLADSSKWGRSGLAKVVRLTEVSMVITDSGIDDRIRGEMEDLGVKVVIA